MGLGLGLGLSAWAGVGAGADAVSGLLSVSVLVPVSAVDSVCGRGGASVSDRGDVSESGRGAALVLVSVLLPLLLVSWEVGVSVFGRADESGDDGEEVADDEASGVGDAVCASR
ncbi:hypothetical protein AOB60_23000 [Streptomyces noursei]|uniref:Uncharacterized protein n=1 Tax=Streptomyces noursei TaxID=1971 RepID=A0A2N8P8B9_STRNR|nr:hypothetical protein AOB60_23000 [Streptomyces noursei]